MHVLICLALCVATVLGHPSGSLRVTGTMTNIEKYPSAASLQRGNPSINSFWAACAGVILNNRAVLTAAHCVHGDNANQWRIFIASSYANPTVGHREVYIVNRIIVHPSYSSRTLDHNIAILHSATTFIFSSRASSASIAGPNYNVADNQTVWAVGWGQPEVCAEPRSPAAVNDRRIRDYIHEVQQVIINQNVCRNNYAARSIAITDNMLCAGWHTNGHGHCDQDSGGPLYHNGVVVGIFTFSVGIAQANFPSVHTRVSRYTSWITSNA